MGGACPGAKISGGVRSWRYPQAQRPQSKYAQNSVLSLLRPRCLLTTQIRKIIALPPAPNRPVLLASLDHRPPERIPPQAITSISWAPMSGRSYHLLATGSRDTLVRVWKLKPSVNASALAVADDENKWTSALVGEFGDHK